MTVCTANSLVTECCVSNGFTAGSDEARGAGLAAIPFLKRSQVFRSACALCVTEKQRRKAVNREAKAIKKAAMADVQEALGMTTAQKAMYAICGAVVLMLGGPLALALVGAEAFLNLGIEKWITDHNLMAALAATYQP